MRVIVSPWVCLLFHCLVLAVQAKPNALLLVSDDQNSDYS